jgi:predicted  nucleic acid-binding Zn-ribbon protein
MEETKKCARCGKVFPLTEFNKVHYGYHHVCKECNRERLKEKAAERAKRKEKAGQDALAEARQQRLSDFTPRELMVELKR